MNGNPRRNIRFAALVTTALLSVSGLPSLSASGSQAPEVVDQCGDVNPASIVVDAGDLGQALIYEFAYDIQSAYVALEAADLLVVEFKACDLPADPTPPESAEDVEAPDPNQTRAPNAVVRLSFLFQFRNVPFEAVATLKMPAEGGLEDSYVFQGAGYVTGISGSVDLALDRVTLFIPKGLMGDPADGEQITMLRAEGHFNETKLDYAPDAVNVDRTDVDPDTINEELILGLLDDPGNGELVEPQHGASYAFGNYPHVVQGGGGGANVVAASLSVFASQTAQTVAAGTAAEYSITVQNQAAQTDTLYLTVDKAMKGFTHRLSENRLDLAAGAQRTVTLTVTSEADASGTGMSVLNIVSRLGARSSQAFATTLTPPAPMIDDDSSADGSGDEDGGAGGDSPGVGTLAFLAAVGGASILFRRRR